MLFFEWICEFRYMSICMNLNVYIYMCLNIYIHTYIHNNLQPSLKHLPNPFTKRVPLDQRHHLDVHHRQQRAQPISFHTPRHHRHPASPQLTPLVGFMGSKTCQVSAPFIGKWYHHIRSPEFKKKHPKPPINLLVNRLFNKTWSKHETAN